MAAQLDRSLETAMGALSLPGVAIGHRIISPGDEHALLPEEAAAFARSVASVRRASGAARIVARRLLGELGHPGGAVPKAASGAPVWPQGIVGSISHDSRIAIAAVARCRDYSALGIDIEPAEDLPAELLDLVATSSERAKIADDPCRGRLLFAAKEAVYKAVYPLEQRFLDHHDFTVDLARRRAVVRGGRCVALRFWIAAHLVVVAFLTAAEGSVAPPTR